MGRPPFPRIREGRQAAGAAAVLNAVQAQEVAEMDVFLGADEAEVDCREDRDAAEDAVERLTERGYEVDRMKDSEFSVRYLPWEGEKRLLKVYQLAQRVCGFSSLSMDRQGELVVEIAKT
jgi:hypothetical protein